MVLFVSPDFIQNAEILSLVLGLFQKKLARPPACKFMISSPLSC